MAQQILMLSYGDQLHKCHLPESEQQEMTIGNDWSDTVTLPALDQSISVAWDGKACNIKGNTLHMNEQLTIHIENSPMHFYLSHFENSKVYDTADKHSITFSANEYDDVSISRTSVDFVLIRERGGQLFQLEVHHGDVYHNFSRTNGNKFVTPGDQLFFDGVTILVSEEEIQIFAPEGVVHSKLTPLVEAENQIGRAHV